jgi:antitoxin VapB
VRSESLLIEMESEWMQYRARIAGRARKARQAGTVRGDAGYGIRVKSRTGEMGERTTVRVQNFDVSGISYPELRVALVSLLLLAPRALLANRCGLTSVYHLYIITDIQMRLTMKTAKVFKSGNSQAVRIPKEFHLKGSEVEIQKKGEVLILRPKRKSWALFFESLEKFSDDFMKSGRKQLPVQQRKRFFP